MYAGVPAGSARVRLHYYEHIKDLDVPNRTTIDGIQRMFKDNIAAMTNTGPLPLAVTDHTGQRVWSWGGMGTQPLETPVRLASGMVISAYHPEPDQASKQQLTRLAESLGSILGSSSSSSSSSAAATAPAAAPAARPAGGSYYEQAYAAASAAPAHHPPYPHPQQPHPQQPHPHPQQQPPQHMYGGYGAGPSHYGGMGGHGGYGPSSTTPSQGYMTGMPAGYGSYTQSHGGYGGQGGYGQGGYGQGYGGQGGYGYGGDRDGRQDMGGGYRDRDRDRDRGRERDWDRDRARGGDGGWRGDRGGGHDFGASQGPRGGRRVALGGRPEDAVVRLRGLPWSARPADLLRFAEPFRVFGANEQEQAQWVGVVHEHDGGRPSGEGYIRLASAQDAQGVLGFHRKEIGSRYIETFPASLAEMEHNLGWPEGSTGAAPPPTHGGYGGGHGYGYGGHAGHGGPGGYGGYGGGYGGGYAGRGPRDHRPGGGPGGFGGHGGPQQQELNEPINLVSEQSALVRLRGLPNESKPEDVLEFLGPAHAPIPGGVHLFMNRAGRSLQAYVEYPTREAAMATMELDKKYMGSRYIEVILSSKQELDRFHGGGSGERVWTIDTYDWDAGTVQTFPTSALSDPSSPAAAAIGPLTVPGLAEPVFTQLRGLPWESTAEDIQAFFRAEGVRPLRMHRSVQDGIGVAAFATAADAQDAVVKLNRKYIGRRFIELAAFTLEMLNAQVAACYSVGRPVASQAQQKPQEQEPKPQEQEQGQGHQDQHAKQQQEEPAEKQPTEQHEGGEEQSALHEHDAASVPVNGAAASDESELGKFDEAGAEEHVAV